MYLHLCVGVNLLYNLLFIWPSFGGLPQASHFQLFPQCFSTTCCSIKTRLERIKTPGTEPLIPPAFCFFLLFHSFYFIFHRCRSSTTLKFDGSDLQSASISFSSVSLIQYNEPLNNESTVGSNMFLQKLMENLSLLFSLIPVPSSFAFLYFYIPLPPPFLFLFALRSLHFLSLLFPFIFLFLSFSVSFSFQYSFNFLPFPFLFSFFPYSFTLLYFPFPFSFPLSFPFFLFHICFLSFPH